MYNYVHFINSFTELYRHYLPRDSEGGALMEDIENTAAPEAETEAPEGVSQAPEGPAEVSPAPKKKRTARDYALSFFIKLGVTGLVLAVLFCFVIGVHVCHTNSAYPTIRDGELCLTSRLSKPEQGDMVVYKRGDEVKFGRVIAFGGDSVNIVSDVVTVNGFGIADDAVYPTSTEGAAVGFPYTVPESCVFVLNDYRSDNTDSRKYGGVPLEDIEGTVVFTVRMRGI